MTQLPSNKELLAEIYNSFDPFELSTSKETYVDCEKVRGEWSVARELGLKITRSKRPTCQLYTGHRGGGKSTELRELKKVLEQEKYFVVLFEADDQDIEPQDVEYADLLFACTRHLVEGIQLTKEHNPLLNWMSDRWESLKDLALTEVTLEGLSLEGQISQFSKITASIKAVPDKRREMRRRINDYTPSLVEALNDFIREAQKILPPNRHKGLVIIVDNLDRIAKIQDAGKPSNYQEIYLNRSEMLRGLACHVIYTVPIEMVYSEWASRIEITYQKQSILPMIMVRNPDGSENVDGVGKLRELICKRIQIIDSRLVQTLEGSVPGVNVPAVFDDPETVRQLCLMSGGHVRILMQLIQKAIDWTDDDLPLPITGWAVTRSIEDARERLLLSIQESQWELLAMQCHLQHIKNDEPHLRLLLNRCLLEYRYYEGQTLKTWRDVNPLIRGMKPFQESLAKVQGS